MKCDKCVKHNCYKKCESRKNCDSHQKCDSYSDCFSYIGATNMAMDTSSCLTNGTLLAGQISYIGSYIGQYINDLQIEYSRTGLADDGKVRPATDRLVGHAFGEVRKQMIIGGENGYTISYVQ